MQTNNSAYSPLKKILFLFIIATIFILISQTAFALQIPKPTNEFFVNDYAAIFSKEEKQAMVLDLQQLEKDTSAEVIVVTIPTLEGEAISDYTTRLAQEWGVGKKDSDNGVVILYAQKENKIFVATGYGMEGILPDSKIGRMLDTYYVPKRDVGEAAYGILDFIAALYDEIELNKAEIGSNYAGDYAGISDDELFFYLFLIIIFVFVGIPIILAILAATGVIKGGRSGGNYGGGWGGGYFGGGFGGGSFGGGGFSGGGGGFGGGGAGR